MDTKLSEFCLKSLMKYLLTDLLEWLEIITWDIWFYICILLSTMELVEFNEIKGGVFENPLWRKNVSKSS